jgi:hypothetical protein
MKLHEVMFDNPFGTIYISGPMTGTSDGGKAAFSKARDTLTMLFPHAAIISPPDEHPIGTISWEAALRLDLKIVLDAVALVAIEDWRESRGASLEVHVARELGIPVFEYPSLRRVLS